MSQPRVYQLVPIIKWLPASTSKSIWTDIVAGLVVAGLLIPEAMAYAGIAGVPPQMGLYAALAAMFMYAIFGTSRQLAVTPTSSSAAMLAALVAPMAVGDSARYALLASFAAVAAGLMFLAGGVFKLGSVSEFVSKPVRKGFVSGLGLTIMVKQAHKLMRVSSGARKFLSPGLACADLAQGGESPDSRNWDRSYCRNALAWNRCSANPLSPGGVGSGHAFCIVVWTS